MIIVADTGPLISLATVGHLFILEEIYPDYLLPVSVYHEVKQYSNLFNSTGDLFLIEKHVRAVRANLFTNEASIGVGESEAISLCKELNAERLLIDDKEARTIAESLNIKCFGTLALLLQAKEHKLVPDIKSILISMVNKRRFFTPDLVNYVLKVANES